MILYNCEIWYPSLDPARPNTKHNKTKPTWQIQLRTTSKEQKAEWEAAGLRIRSNIPDDGSAPYYSATIYRKAVKNDGSEGKAPEVVNGELEPIDPRTIGNGSIANVRIFQYMAPATADSPEKLTSVLMAVQITTHVVYTPRPREPEETFAAATTKVVGELPKATSEDDADHQTSNGFTRTTPPSEPPANSDMARETPTF